MKLCRARLLTLPPLFPPAFSSAPIPRCVPAAALSTSPPRLLFSAVIDLSPCLSQLLPWVLLAHCSFRSCPPLIAIPEAVVSTSSDTLPYPCVPPLAKPAQI